MDCGTSTAKYVLFASNTLVLIFGCAGIVFGSIMLANLGDIKFGDKYPFPPQAILPTILIGLGAIISIISLLGCCGAIRESICMTVVYATFLFILLAAELTLIVLFYVDKDKYINQLGDVIDEVWEFDKKQKGVFDTLQKSFKCCGKVGVIDYNFHGPASCCEKPIDNVCNALRSATYPGCRQTFLEFMTGGSELAQYGGIGLIVFEAIAFILACCLANNLRTYKAYGRY